MANSFRSLLSEWSVGCGVVGMPKRFRQSVVTGSPRGWAWQGRPPYGVFRPRTSLGRRRDEYPGHGERTRHGGMANERLRAALLQRGVTPNELAESVGVDPKTIERWIGGRVPYRRHRYRVASRLGIDEAYLWPGALAAEQVASASESEILVLYPHRWAVPRNIWGQLFDSAEEEIGLLVYSGMFIADDPGLLALFRAKAAQGVRVRILLGDPDAAEVASRGALEGIGDAMASKIRNVLVRYNPLRGGEGVGIRFH